MTAACQAVPVLVQACDMDEATRQWACELAADAALDTNLTMVVVGEIASDSIVLCPDQCSLFRPGVLVVIPDVDVVQLGHVPEGSIRMERESDHRMAYVVAGVEATR